MSKRRPAAASRPPVRATETSRREPNRWNDSALLAAMFALLLLATFAVYGRALGVPFVFDDGKAIMDNTTITQLWPLVGDDQYPGPLSLPRNLPTSGRPLVNYSFALNYAVGGLNPVGYRIINILLHVCSAMLLGAIVRRTLRLDRFGRQFENTAWPLSVVVALLWALHPLQSEAVIYVTQRTELMVGFFYLSTLYSSLRYWIANSPAARTTWLVLATLSCLVGMASKEVMVTAPLVVLLFERAFVAGSFRAALRRSWPLYVGLAMGWLLLAVLNANSPRSTSAGFSLPVAAYEWWFTQAKILLMYLKLVVWPWPLVIHYGTPPLFHAFGEAAPWLLAATLLAIGTLLLLWRNSPAGFLTAAMWLILSPTLVVPIPTEVAAERRMYLPLAALLTLVIVGGYRLFQPTRVWSKAAAVAAVVVVSVACCLVTVHRLAAYADPLTLWQDTLANSPDDPVGIFGRATVLLHQGKTQEAIADYEYLLQHQATSADVFNNLATALIDVGRVPEAAALLERALQLEPDYPEANSNMGLALVRLGKPQEAVDYWQKALRLKPNIAEAHNNLANVLWDLGQLEPALEHWNEALRIKPDYPNAQVNMGLALLKAGRPQEALVHFQQAVSLNPTYTDAYQQLGTTLLALGRPQEAIEHFAQVVRLQPESLPGWVKLADANAQAQHLPEAIVAATRAAELARAQGETQAAQEIEGWLKTQRAGGGPTSPAAATPQSVTP